MVSADMNHSQLSRTDYRWELLKSLPGDRKLLGRAAGRVFHRIKEGVASKCSEGAQLVQSAAASRGAGQRAGLNLAADGRGSGDFAMSMA